MRLLRSIIQSVFEKNKRRLLTFSFFFGFIVDNLTLNRVDQLLDNIILLSYVFLAMGSLLLAYGAIAEKFSEKTNHFFRKVTPFLIQYAFGGLFSGMLIFYGRSGFWMVSWPFLIIILAVIIGNETIRDRVQRLIYNVSMLFIGLFAYIVLIVPVVIGKMGAVVFVGSGILALIIMLVFVRVLALIVPRFISINYRSLLFAIGLIYFGFHFLYFANIIPPIPLSLKDAGIYHSVVKFEDGTYQLTYEKGNWWQFFKNSDNVFHPVPGGNVFCFAKVFAPTKIATNIYHKWEYYDEDAKVWKEHARLSYPITGGSDGGYRGYTLIENYRAGSWRCTVETGRGQVLGQEDFTVDMQTPVGELVTKRQ